jgi:phosphoglycerate dehydrogenase-like enzyme
MKPRALYFRILAYSLPAMELLHRHFDVIELGDPRDETNDILAGIDVLTAPLGYPVTATRMGLAPRLKAIVSNTTGVPHIDMEEATKRGISVCALHDEQPFLNTITPTAEHTIGLMLAAWRRIPAAHAAATRGEWDRNPWGAPRMFSRMRLGLVGHGRLGSKVARIARAMDMDVAFYDPFLNGTMPNLSVLAARSDILSLHAPAIASTHKIVSREIMRTLPKGAMIVNTARGELLDEEALLDLLETGHLSAAALDVIDGEYDPDFAENPLRGRLFAYARTHDNLVLTPHIGGSTFDAWSETQCRVVEKAARALAKVASP